MVRKFNLKISPSKFCKQLYLGHPVLILTLKSKCFKKGWTGKGKPVLFPSLSDMWLPSEAGGGSGTGRGGGRWFQRRRQDDPQEQASLLCWMNIHKCVSYFCKHGFMSPLWIKPGVFALKSFHCVLVGDFASLVFLKPATKKLVSTFSVRVSS